MNDAIGAGATAAPGDEVIADPNDPRRAIGADGLLAPFNAAGVLSAVDVHVARRLGALGGEHDAEVLLAIALAVRGPRLGHVFVDLRTAATEAVVERDPDADLSALPWPEPSAWRQRVAASPIVAVVGSAGGHAEVAPPLPGELAPDRRPVVLQGDALYLDRYRQEELRLADDLLARATERVDGVDEQALEDGIARLFGAVPARRDAANSSEVEPDLAAAQPSLFDAPQPEAGIAGDPLAGRPDDAQASAARIAVQRRLSVIAGGPGTGKTTTVARVVVLLLEQAIARDRRMPRIALAAPTGKAAARLQEALRQEAATLDTAQRVRDALGGVEASTLHRLLGARPNTSSYRHHRGNRLPHDVVIVDETSMVALSMMARLAEAVREDARLCLVGDPDQLRSIEAGAVLGDIVGNASHSGDRRPAIAGSVVVLRTVHRFGGAIAALAGAIRDADADAALAALRTGDAGVGGAAAAEVAWLDGDALARGGAAPATAAIRAEAVASGLAVIEAAQAGDARAALTALGRFRILCAHRQGPHGAQTWIQAVERWLAEAGADVDGRWYAGRPLLMTANDYGLRLYNGDTGVVLGEHDRRRVAVFERADGPVEVGPARLGAVETVHAMTVHKSQGSQFRQTAVILPDPSSPILTREWLYTAVTRASDRVLIAGTEAAIRAAIERPAARASGLRARLWGE